MPTLNQMNIFVLMIISLLVCEIFVFQVSIKILKKRHKASLQQCKKEKKNLIH